MKKLLLSLTFLGTVLSYAQDTTAFRLVAGGYDQVHFFNNDTTYMETNSTSGVVHVLFINPADSLLYGIIDDPGSTGDRNLYTIDPFSGATSLVADLTITYTNSGDIGEGVLYLISGNGDGTPGVVTSVDLGTFAETTLFTSAVAGAGNPTATEYNPNDSSIYIFNSFDYELYVYDLASGTESAATSFTYNSSDNDEHHGAYYDADNDQFLLGTYGGEIYQTNTSPYTTLDFIYDGTSSESTLDLCILDYTLRSDTNYYHEYCPNVDSFMVSLIYDVASVKWYKDGVEIPGATNDTIWVSAAGTYRALMEIGTTGDFVWSEVIECDPYTVPNVNITANGDSMLCSNESMITLTGANPGGGSAQWYMDGTMIGGETGQTIDVTQAGVYNQIKINADGCSDSSAVGYEVFVDNTPLTVTISNTNSDTEICPGETIVLDGATAGGTLQWFMDGMAIAGETGTSYDATAEGSYNLLMTLNTGCSDSSATAYVITADPNCTQSISEEDLNANTSIYPIPFDSELKIESPETIEKVELINLDGRVVKTVKTNSKVININTDQVATGSYLVKAYTSSNKIILRKVVK